MAFYEEFNAEKLRKMEPSPIFLTERLAAWFRSQKKSFSRADLFYLRTGKTKR